jgi:hypothetical protein
MYRGVSEDSRPESLCQPCLGAAREIERLRSVAEQLLEVVMLDSAALYYGLKRRKAIEAAGAAGVRIPA